MAVLLPVLALGVAVMAFRARMGCWREAVLSAAVAWGVVLLGLTEGLSLVHALTPPASSAAWLFTLLAELAIMTRIRAWPRLSIQRPIVNRLDLAVLTTLAATALVLGAISLMSPPNTWDSMTYHMARVVHWEQNASLAPYATHNLRQLYLQPWSELVILHLQLLSGGDHFAGLVQWASMLGVLVGTSVIARGLGARRQGDLCAVVFAASVPIGVLESVSTQNDYVVTFWLVCVVFFALRIAHSAAAPLPWAACVGLGASLGLALVTKATAYLVALPVLIWVGVALYRRSGACGAGLLVASGAIAVALNTGVYTRNLTVFGSPLGPPDEGRPALRYVNDAMTPALFVSNVVRDLGLNVVTTPSVAINVRAFQLVQTIHGWLGLDIADPRTTWGDAVFSEQRIALAFDENFAGNPIHLVLIVLALMAIWPLRRLLPPALGRHAAVLTAGFLLFAGVLRWQPWHTRLELPFFVLGAPLVGIVAERIAPRLARLLAVFLLISVLPWVVNNQAHPLIGPQSILSVPRSDQYFTYRPDLLAPALAAIGFLAERGCDRVGFFALTGDAWEYPFWALAPGPIEIEHVGVGNLSAQQGYVRDDPFEPCAVLSIAPDTGSSPGPLELNGIDYLPTLVRGELAVLTRDGG